MASHNSNNSRDVFRGTVRETPKRGPITNTVGYVAPPPGPRKKVGGVPSPFGAGPKKGAKGSLGTSYVNRSLLTEPAQAQHDIDVKRVKAQRQSIPTGSSTYESQRARGTSGGAGGIGGKNSAGTRTSGMSGGRGTGLSKTVYANPNRAPTTPTADSYNPDGTLNASVGSSLLAMDVRGMSNPTNNITGQRSSGSGGGLREAGGVRPDRIFPDVSHLSREFGGLGPGTPNEGPVDREASRLRRGLATPGRRGPSLGSKRPDTPLSSLLKANTPPDSEQGGEQRKTKRLGRTKQPAPSTMMQGVANLG